MQAPDRNFSHLSCEQMGEAVGVDSVLCVPVGAFEQHGPHLPLGTDAILARSFAESLVVRYGESHDLWLMPSFEFGLSSEHAWSDGTISLSIELYVRLFHEVVRGLVHSQPARNMVLVNGHGGNRGVLEALIQEFRAWYGVVAIVMHPSALSDVRSSSGFAEVHSGKGETSRMMAVAPELVAGSRIPSPLREGDQPDASALVLSRSVTWPWYSNDAGIGQNGVIGDAAAASPELGQEILDSALANAQGVLDTLIAFGKQVRESQA